MWMLTKCLAQELAPHGIRVNAIGPGFIETPMTQTLRANEARSRWAMDLTPMGRYGTAQEIASTALFLASDESAFFTGEILHPSAASRRLRPRVTDALNAFVPGVEVRVAGRAGRAASPTSPSQPRTLRRRGPSDGRGNPDWARQHPLPTPAMPGGQTCSIRRAADRQDHHGRGSLGILGDKPFYGTPLNTRAPAACP